MLFHGLSAFPITPADRDGRVDTGLLSHLLDRLCAAGVGSIGLLGSTGAYMYLSHAERRRAVAAAVEAVAGRVPLMVGVGALRTDHAVSLADDARAAGADALLLAPVSYTPLTQEEAFIHYDAVAAATDLPLCIYNNPGTTHFTFGTDLLARLAAIPTICAVKMPLPGEGDAGRDVAELRERTGLSIGYSGDWGAARTLLAGADAFYSVLAGLMPQPMLALVTAARSGDRNRTAALNERLEPLWRCFQAHGSLRVMYVLLNELGLPGAEPPKPILPLMGEARESVLMALDHVWRAEELEASTGIEPVCKDLQSSA